MNKYQLSQETMQVRCDPYPQCTGVGVDAILWHAQTCWRSIFSTVFAKCSSDATSGYQYCSNLFAFATQAKQYKLCIAK